MSKPVNPTEPSVDQGLKLFSLEAWPIWIIFIVVVISVVLTMAVVRVKRDRQLRRINTVKRKLRVVPSVSWEEVITTSYIVPLNGTMRLRVLKGRGRQGSLPPPKPVEQRLPPAEIEKRESTPAYTEDAAPEPEEDVHLSQAGTIPPPGKASVCEDRLDLCNENNGYSLPAAGKRIFGHGIRIQEHQETAPKPIHSGGKLPGENFCDHSYSLEPSTSVLNSKDLPIHISIICKMNRTIKNHWRR
jgi:hypothetical protein